MFLKSKRENVELLPTASNSVKHLFHVCEFIHRIFRIVFMFSLSTIELPTYLGTKGVVEKRFWAYVIMVQSSFCLPAAKIGKITILPSLPGVNKQKIIIQKILLLLSLECFSQDCVFLCVNFFRNCFQFFFGFLRVSFLNICFLFFNPLLWYCECFLPGIVAVPTRHIPLVV